MPPFANTGLCLEPTAQVVALPAEGSAGQGRGRRADYSMPGWPQPCPPPNQPKSGCYRAGGMGHDS
eukprot:10967892-Lingulodinium_polyedra.AAC.1